MTKGFIVSAPSSGTGKTLVTLGLIRALKRRGHAVAIAKTGPDYIDPGFLGAAADGSCINLDPWAMRPGTLARLADGLCGRADIAIVEGVMGLFDGPPGGCGSTADLAVLLGLPVVLLIDAGRQAQSVGAFAEGFARHRGDVSVAGVICNRVASPRHAGLLREGLATSGLTVLGMLPPLAGLELESRHLGLVQARERIGLEALIEAAADAVTGHLDLDAIVGFAESVRAPEGKPEAPLAAPPGHRVAVACDDAFGFAYAHLLDGWRAAGAEIVPFSPLAGEGPTHAADAICLPGGYPELHAGAIAANAALMDGLRAAARAGIPVHGECGGYMVLGDGIVDADGVRHEMAGLLRLETSFAERRMTLGYRQAEIIGTCALGAAGSKFRGHEFHYATIAREDGTPLFRLRDASATDLGRTGLVSGSVSGSFFHMIDIA